MIKIKFRLSLHRCNISLHIFCNNLFPSSSFCFHTKPRSQGVKATLTTLTTVFPLLCGHLFSLTLDHIYFLLILDSVFYLIWTIIVIKNQKLFSMKNYQLVKSVKYKCIVFIRDTCLWYKI